jgi:hypothetical protein
VVAFDRKKRFAFVCSTGKTGSSPLNDCRMIPTAHFHLMLRLKICGTTPPFNIHFWVSLSTGTTQHFYITSTLNIASSGILMVVI